METIFNALLLNERGLRATPQGVEIDVRLPWYRALPVSVVEIAALSVDGQPVDTSTLRFEINGKSFGMSELAEQVQDFWFVLDSAVLRLPTLQLARGTEHTVELQLNLYPPYIPHLTWVTQSRKVIRAQ